jgi:hypothetical protein
VSAVDVGRNLRIHISNKFSSGVDASDLGMILLRITILGIED